MTEVANTYGQALYNLAEEEGLTEEILGQITVLVNLFQAEPAFLQLLCSPVIAKAERCQVLDGCLRGQIHPYLLNYLKVLTENGYARHFPGCCQVFRQHYNRANHIMPVTVVTRFPLSDDLRQKLLDRLTEVTGKTIELECRTNPECLGGICLDFDGMQLDGTVRHRLDELRAILKQTVLG